MDRGFTLIELLLSSALALAVVGLALSVVTSARDSADRDAASGDLAQRLRIGADTMVQEIRATGAGGSFSGVVSAADAIALVEPLASIDVADADSDVFHALRMTSLRVAAEGMLRAAGPAAGILALAPPPSCPALPGVCGLAPGDMAVVFDRAGVFDLFEVSAADSAGFTITPDRLLASVYGPRAVVAGVDRATFGLTSDREGGKRLVKITEAGATLPIVDHVVSFEVRPFGRAEPPLPGRDELEGPTYGPWPPRAGEDDVRERWGAGQGCTVMLNADGTHAPRLASLGAATDVVRLSPDTLTDGPWCPGRTVGANYDADLLRIRRVDLHLRVEVASARLRGPAGRLYFRPGSHSRSASWVPDAEVHLSIVVRNLAS